MTDSIHHTVRPGDNLWDLDIEYGLPHGSIAAANRLSGQDADLIWPGAVLHVPVASEPDPTPEPPEPDPVPAGETIWTTPIATDATLIPSGLSADFMLDGQRYVSGLTLDLLHVQIIDPKWPWVDIWESQERPSDSTPSKRTRLIARLPIDPTFVHDPQRSNDLSVYVDDALGTITGVPYKVITGGGTTTRLTRDSPIFHNWEVPPAKYQDEMGTLLAPGRSGQTGAARLSALGTYISKAEFDAAVDGNVDAIQHAIGLLVWGKAFLSRTNNGHRWPAYTADGNYANSSSGNYYDGSVPEMRMGAHLALEDRLTAADLPILGQTGDIPNFFRAVAEVLYRFGGYVGDNTAWKAYALKMDAKVGDDAISKVGDRQNMAKLIAMCSVVDSTGPDSIGGGNGTRRT